MWTAAVLAVFAQAAATTAATITQPDWVRKPTGEDMAQYYPAHASLAGLSGRVVLYCRVDGQGGLVDCGTEEENPTGEGFADAALKMTHIFKMKPLSINGQPVAGGSVRIPILFRMQDSAPDQLSATLLCYGRMATLAEQDPSKPDSWYAARFWALQAMAAAANAHQPPSGLERDLFASHQLATREPSPLKARQQAEACDAGMQQALKKAK